MKRLFLVMVLAATPCLAQEGAPHAEGAGWYLGLQAFSLHRLTFFEAVDAAESLGLHYIEAIPFQKLSKEQPDVLTNHTTTPEVRDSMRKKLAEARVRLISYGVADLPNDPATCRAVFNFARDMHIQTIVAEPPPGEMTLVTVGPQPLQTLAGHGA